VATPASCADWPPCAMFAAAPALAGSGRCRCCLVGECNPHGWRSRRGWFSCAPSVGARVLRVVLHRAGGQPTRRCSGLLYRLTTRSTAVEAARAPGSGRPPHQAAYPDDGTPSARTVSYRSAGTSRRFRPRRRQSHLTNPLRLTQASACGLRPSKAADAARAARRLYLRTRDRYRVIAARRCSSARWSWR